MKSNQMQRSLKKIATNDNDKGYESVANNRRQRGNIKRQMFSKKTCTVSLILGVRKIRSYTLISIGDYDIQSDFPRYLNSTV